MSNPQFKPWSNNPNAPKIPYALYLEERSYFAGTLIGSILYGVLIVLFSKCTVALCKPAYRRGEGIKWGLVSFTVVMFSSATVVTAMNLHIQSISYIDNREYPGVGAPKDLGPYGYFLFIYYQAINVIPNAAYILNSWLADGFLLYRCYVIYSKNLWVIASPCLMYFASVAMGILMICPIDRGHRGARFGLPYFSISLSLNVLLTLMITVRLILHGRKIRAMTGSQVGISGLYNSIATILIESSALYAVSSLLVIGPLAADSPVVDLFTPILAETQVIAPLLIIQRVINKSALTSNNIPGDVCSSKAGNRGKLTGGSGALANGHPMSSVGGRGMDPDELGAGVEASTIDFQRDRV